MLDLDQTVEQAPPTQGSVGHLLECLKAAGEPISLSINGKGNLPITDDGSFQILVSLIERLEVTEMLRERLAELNAGAPTYRVEQAKEMIRAKHGISV